MVGIGRHQEVLVDIRPAELVAVILGCRMDPDHHLLAGMQPDAGDRYGGF